MRKLYCMLMACSLIFVMSGCGQTQEPMHEQPASVEPIADDESPETPISGNPAGSVEAVPSQVGRVESDPSRAGSADSDDKKEPEGSETTVESSYSFDFETKTVMLNSGYEMPIYGLGTYSLTGEVCVDSVSAALDRGVRLIDTAYMYHNEESVGEAIRNSGIPREEIFVITKLYPNQFSDPEAAIEAALDKLDIEYIDARVIIGLS